MDEDKARHERLMKEYIDYYKQLRIHRKTYQNDTAYTSVRAEQDLVFDLARSGKFKSIAAVVTPERESNWKKQMEQADIRTGAPIAPKFR